MPEKDETRKELSKKYQDATQRLTASIKESRSKSYFLAQASHDLRQPLHALRIFTSLLEATELNTQQQALVKKIADSADNMQKLLKNYLDLSRLDYGGIKYEEEVFSLHELTDKLAEEFSLVCFAERKYLHYIPCSLDIAGDYILIERLLRNLLSNAIKYAKHKVVLGCKRRGKNVQLVVMDDGTGIDNNDLPYIFDEFYQSGLNPNNKKNGAGLGLAIAKKIADLFLTNIRIRTKQGQGTCFSFTLPLA